MVAEAPRSAMQNPASRVVVADHLGRRGTIVHAAETTPSGARTVATRYLQQTTPEPANRSGGEERFRTCRTERWT